MMTHITVMTWRSINGLGYYFIIIVIIVLPPCSSLTASPRPISQAGHCNRAYQPYDTSPMTSTPPFHGQHTGGPHQGHPEFAHPTYFGNMGGARLPSPLYYTK